MIENVVLVALVLLICVVTDVALLIIVKLLPLYYPSELKTSRWEAGNPPIKYPKFVLPMQYLGFMFMFMAAEPIIVVLLILSAYPSQDFVVLTLVVLLLLLSAIYVGYRTSLEIAGLKPEYGGRR